MPNTATIAEIVPLAASDPRPGNGGGVTDGRGGEARRAQLRAWLGTQSPALNQDEVEAHFAGMPPHYWERVSEADLAWGLAMIHRFLAAVATPGTPATMPIIDWRHLPDGQGTSVMLCTWDRRGLLAKAAACFSAANLSIRQADIFTRADHIVLDVFQVCESNGRGPAGADKLEQMGFLLDGALSEPPRFASVWACSRHKFLAPPARQAPRITFDNESAHSATLLRVEASDRLGLLYDVLQTLAEAGLNVTQAGIQTEGEIAGDVLHLTDANGQKLTGSGSLDELRRALETAITVHE